MTQNKAIKTPKIPWVLTKDEKKNYDQIFRAWDQSGSGFISGEVAQDVFGQSGLNRDDMAKIWYVLCCHTRRDRSCQLLRRVFAPLSGRLPIWITEESLTFKSSMSRWVSSTEVSSLRARVHVES